MSDRDEAALVAPNGGGADGPQRDRSTELAIETAQPRAWGSFSSGGAAGVMYFGGMPPEEEADAS